MGLKEVLLFLFEKLGHGRRSLVVDYYRTVQRWDKSVLPILLEEKLLQEAESAKDPVCYLCDKQCVKTVMDWQPEAGIFPGFKPTPGQVWHGYFCDEKTTGVGWTHVTEWDLKQWQLTNEMLIAWLTKYLRLEPPKEANRAGVIQIGTTTLNDETYALALAITEELALLVNGNAVPMVKIFQVSEGGAIDVDTSLIEQHRCRKAAEITPEKPKKPTSAKKQLREEETQKLHAAWRKEYKKIRQQYPDKSKYSDSWIARKIEKLPIAQGRSFDTIRKNMVL